MSCQFLLLGKFLDLKFPSRAFPPGGSSHRSLLLSLSMPACLGNPEMTTLSDNFGIPSISDTDCTPAVAHASVEERIQVRTQSLSFSSWHLHWANADFRPEAGYRRLHPLNQPQHLSSPTEWQFLNQHRLIKDKEQHEAAHGLSN